MSSISDNHRGQTIEHSIADGNFKKKTLDKGH